MSGDGSGGSGKGRAGDDHQPPPPTPVLRDNLEQEDDNYDTSDDFERPREPAPVPPRRTSSPESYEREAGGPPPGPAPSGAEYRVIPRVLRLSRDEEKYLADQFEKAESRTDPTEQSSGRREGSFRDRSESRRRERRQSSEGESEIEIPQVPLSPSKTDAVSSLQTQINAKRDRWIRCIDKEKHWMRPSSWNPEKSQSAKVEADALKLEINGQLHSSAYFECLCGVLWKVREVWC